MGRLMRQTARASGQAEVKEWWSSVREWANDEIHLGMLSLERRSQVISNEITLLLSGVHTRFPTGCIFGLILHRQTPEGNSFGLHLSEPEGKLSHISADRS